MSITGAIAAKFAGVSLATFTVGAQIVSAAGGHIGSLTAVGLASAAGLVGYGALRSEVRRNTKDIATLAETLDERLGEHRAALSGEIGKVDQAVRDLTLTLVDGRPPKRP